MESWSEFQWSTDRKRRRRQLKGKVWAAAVRRAAAADRVIDTCKFEQRFHGGSSNPPFSDCRKLSVNMSARGVAHKELLSHPPQANVAFKTIHT
ncbi:unnamed protein product [Arctia plantaginis]|uniref:Uncharacterized protein n=1 Tax=Arctia plantaginis TaxID=874455 RepID=A0A8S1BQL4_ARCPL|nr:unnamed protein product [Arctia plantaginis]